MSDAAKMGKIGWIDITIEDAEELRDFYSAVAVCKQRSGKGASTFMNSPG